MYFIKNIADEKLEVYFSKEIYQKLPLDEKKFITSTCLFSKSRDCWRSRAKLPSTYRLVTWLTEHGFEDRGSEGEKLSFADKVDREQEKATERADRMESRHDKAKKESESHWKAADRLASIIPMGQPILVGHHSERSHRNHLKKIESNMNKSIEADEKAEYYRRRFNSAAATAEGAKFKDPGYLVNRVKECNARIAKLKRYVDLYPTEAARYTASMEEEQDKLGYMRYCLSLIQVETALYDKDKMEDAIAAGVKTLKVNGRWFTIVRLNKTTVSVENPCFTGNPEAMRKWPLKYYYEKIEEVK